ncbi:homoserine O-acetyltransferase MetA [Agilicoccus flavus]|uniref:homoserine O-acetyltransferase MetA n=1 Tax=Agilicoccus flavus TaxID=2775968 RepID=UPI001CF606A5|nr:homoserine O-succinyltransferase [Agilicoccus flavus]
MPVNIPRELPARSVLQDENVFVMSRDRAQHQDIRPLRIAILNLMPTKIATETHLLRLLGNSPIQVEITLLRMGTHESRNTPPEHLESFYTTFDAVRSQRFDGLVITGAPVELLPFEDVDYWGELVEILDWSREHVWSTMHVCWGAQAGLYHHHGVPKYELPAKMFGIFAHQVLDPRAPILSGFDEVFPAPHSRHTEVRAEDVEAVPGVRVLATSPDAGVYLAATDDGRQIYVTGHPEYERDTLRAEYDRDVARGLRIQVPHNYFPGDDPAGNPLVTWRSHAFLLYSNWLNHCVYQGTPFDLDTGGDGSWVQI